MAKKTITIEERPVNYVCQRCGRLTTRLMYPGPTPKYCDDCRPIVEREKNRERQAKFKAAKKQAAKQGETQPDQSSD